MRKLGEQWVEVIDGKRHMLKAVKVTRNSWPVDEGLRDGYFFTNNKIVDGEYSYYEVVKAKVLGIVNDEGFFPCPFCGEYPKIGNFGDGFSDTTFYVKHNQSECVICGLMRTKSFKTKQQAIDEWDRRA